jgi:hypothetical protein
VAFLARLLFALFVTGGALPASGPSTVHGFDVVEEDETSTQGASVKARAVRQAKRGMKKMSRGGGLAVLDVPSVLDPTRTQAQVQAPTWMRPRRTPPPDDDDDAVV